MRIKDKIANQIIELLEERGYLKINKAEYLDVECAVADLIQTEIKGWLSYDVDLMAKQVD